MIWFSKCLCTYIVGKKNGKGYYTYNKGSKPEADHSVIQIVEESMRLTNIAPAGKVCYS